MVARRGHSLVELIVTMMVLGVALSGVAATHVLSLRLTAEAFRLGDAAAGASAVLDSLTTHVNPVAGAATAAPIRYEWTVSETAEGWSRVVVTASDARSGAPILELTGARVTEPPWPRNGSGSVGSDEQS